MKELIAELESAVRRNGGEDWRTVEENVFNFPLWNPWRRNGGEDWRTVEVDLFVGDMREALEYLKFMSKFRHKIGTRLKKKSGSDWSGKVVGFYSTDLTPEGYAIESDAHKGSVQIYPVSALEAVK